jgi:hypothetical protein
MKIMEYKGINIAIAMTITFSKVMALLIIVLSFLMDFLNDKGGTVFMFAIPFAVFLITGKQAIDWKKEQVKTDK